MTKKVTLWVTSQFGSERCYPGCEFSKLISKLCRQKTFTFANIKILEEAGYEIEKVYKPNWNPKDGS